jgi:hypothetical protein
MQGVAKTARRHAAQADHDLIEEKLIPQVKLIADPKEREAKMKVIRRTRNRLTGARPSALHSALRMQFMWHIESRSQV